MRRKNPSAIAGGSAITARSPRRSSRSEQDRGSPTKQISTISAPSGQSRAGQDSPTRGRVHDESAERPPQDPAEKVSHVISVFRNYDRNNDGVLDLSELDRLVWSLNPQFSKREMEVLRQAIDLNGDGIVQYEEFIKWLFGDEKALARLSGAGPQSPRTGRPQAAPQIDIYAPNGSRLRLQLSVNDTVKDLCLRACVPLGLPVERMSDVHVRLKSGSANLPDDKLLENFKRHELQVVLKNQNQMFSASGRSLLKWQADVVEAKSRIQAPADVGELLYVEELDVLCAVMGGSQIAAWDADAKQQLWQKSLTAVTALACHRDKLYAGTDQGTVYAYDAATGRDLWRSTLRNDFIRALHVVGAHGLLCAGTHSGKICAWDLASGEKIWQKHHRGEDSQVWHLAGDTEPNATYPGTLFSGSLDSIVAWDARVGEEKWCLPALVNQRIYHSLFYREFYDTICMATQAVAGTRGESVLCSFDGRTGEELFKDQVNDICFMQGRRQFLYTATSRAVQAWDTLNQNKCWEVQMFGRGTNSIQAFAFAEDLDAVFVGSAEGLHVLDARNGSARGQLSLRGGVRVLNYTSL